MKRFALVIALIAFLAFLTGCGNTSSTKLDTTTETSESQILGGSTETNDREITGDGSQKNRFSESCSIYLQIKDLFIKAAVEVNPSSETIRKMETLSSSIPDEIREDYEIVLEAYRKRSQTTQEDAEEQGLGQNIEPNVRQAQRDISSRSRDECGIQ